VLIHRLSGLGLGIGCRLIDDFLATQPASESLTIIFTTRSSRKSDETLATLEAHLARHKLNEVRQRIHFQPENVELTSLLSVRALARRLLASDLPYIDAVILNAGIGGWIGLDWPLAIWTFVTSIRQSTTWPKFKLGAVGLVAKPQFPADVGALSCEQPLLGELFCANVFGHYMLLHWLMPLLRACRPESPGKIIWMSSIEAVARHYNPADHQGLETDAAYEHTKRMTDYLALTSRNQPATARLVEEFCTPSRDMETHNPRPLTSTPAIGVVHPGICTTTIISLYWIVHQAYRLAIYMARWCGSPWANVTSYIGSLSAVWLALISAQDLEAEEAKEGGGPCKWGTAVDRRGRASVRRTDVEGWGINGTGEPFGDKWWGGTVGRKSGSKDATKEDVQQFVAEGAEVWRKMEALRKDWEARIREYETQR